MIIHSPLGGRRCERGQRMTLHVPLDLQNHPQAVLCSARGVKGVGGPEDPASCAGTCAGPAQGDRRVAVDILNRSFASKSRMFNPFLFLSPPPPECRTLRSAEGQGPAHCAGIRRQHPRGRGKGMRIKWGRGGEGRESDRAAYDRSPSSRR
eukprot:scaffold10404_cov117-Isochrysis_galbana.AAC.3